MTPSWEMPISSLRAAALLTCVSSDSYSDVYVDMKFVSFLWDTMRPTPTHFLEGINL
jgi:hypothetical protein